MVSARYCIFELFEPVPVTLLLLELGTLTLVVIGIHKCYIGARYTNSDSKQYNGTKYPCCCDSTQYTVPRYTVLWCSDGTQHPGTQYCGDVMLPRTLYTVLLCCDSTQCTCT